ncbi:hypothetical protein, partial [Sphingomonas sp. Leaf37]|uniref:hypothetical protein n=1 Tax=Sphingomonas sp. Leaf37 TaxID=2876552 RepID=UPI001E655698
MFLGLPLCLPESSLVFWTKMLRPSTAAGDGGELTLYLGRHENSFFKAPFPVGGKGGVLGGKRSALEAGGRDGAAGGDVILQVLDHKR